VTSEATVRQLRAIVYGECSDGNWEACKEHWLRPDSVKWLGDEAAKILNDQSNEKVSVL
jgi:hypothetical protein